MNMPVAEPENDTTSSCSSKREASVEIDNAGSGGLADTYIPLYCEFL